jgi:REP element-mobilizing transposase RayT
MPSWHLFYHIVWSTKHRAPLLTPSAGPVIHGFLRSKAVGLGATALALNGAEDCVHMVVSIPLRIAVAKFVEQVKAIASARFNKPGLSDLPFLWQAEYGLMSFDGKRRLNYLTYARHQKENHSGGTTIPSVERVADLRTAALS